MNLFFDFENGSYADFKALLAFNEFSGDVYAKDSTGGSAPPFVMQAVDVNRQSVFKFVGAAGDATPSSFNTDFPDALHLVGSLSIQIS